MDKVGFRHMLSTHVDFGESFWSALGHCLPSVLVSWQKAHAFLIRKCCMQPVSKSTC